MRPSLMEILVCPDCLCGLVIDVAQSRENGEIERGTLRCERCLNTYPIRSGIPRFADSGAEEYSANFSWQWNRFRRTQIDAFSGLSESETRFRNETGWTPESLKGRLVLDAGCGAGRFSSIAANWGARVIAVDLASGAVDACAETLREQGLVADVVQASIYSLPFRPETFSHVFSLGVLQHTPDPDRAMRALPNLVAPGGHIAYWIYERRWYQLFMIRNYLRVVSARLPLRVTRYLAVGLTVLFLPVALTMSWIPYARQLIPFLPVSARVRRGMSLKQMWEWTTLDTFDSYSARYEFNQRAEWVTRALSESGMGQIRRLNARGMAITAYRRPGGKGNGPG